MIDLTSYSALSWLVLLGFLLLPAIIAAYLLAGAEWLVRSLVQSSTTTAKYHRGNLWLGNHFKTLVFCAYVAAAAALYFVYVDRICSRGISGEFCL